MRREREGVREGGKGDFPKNTFNLDHDNLVYDRIVAIVARDSPNRRNFREGFSESSQPSREGSSLA